MSQIYREKCYNWHRYQAKRPPTCGCQYCNDKWGAVQADYGVGEEDDVYTDFGLEPDAPPPFKFDAYTKPPVPLSFSYHRQELPKHGFWLFIDSDQHYPIHDPAVEAVKAAIARDIKPFGYVDGGDTYDVWSLSTHEKENGKIWQPGARLQEEFDSAQPWWRFMNELIPQNGFMYYLLGNHEDRVNRFLSNNMTLFGLRSMDFKRMAEIPERVQVLDNYARLNIGNVRIEHGNRLMGSKKLVSRPVEWLLNQPRLYSTVFGHTHKLEMKWRRLYTQDGQAFDTFALNLGHGQDVTKQNFDLEPNWVNGFAALRFETKAGKLEVTPFPIRVDLGVAYFDGKVYDGNKLI